MNRWNLVVDVPLCMNCQNCVLATRDELDGNDHPGYSAPHASQTESVIRIERRVRGATPMVDATYVPRMCNHCDDAPCIKAAGDGSIRKRDDGIVIIDPVKARGRRDLVAACPYGAMVWNESAQLPQNWFFDAHLLDAGAPSPRCVSVCPTEALKVIKVTDVEMQKRASREELRVLQPELGTRPRVWYRNLSRFDHCFIGGSLSFLQDGIDECASGAQVELSCGDDIIGEAASDSFGDFKFDRLPPRSGPYRLRVRHRDLIHVMDVSLEAVSIYLGEIRLGLS